MLRWRALRGLGIFLLVMIIVVSRHLPPLDHTPPTSPSLLWNELPAQRRDVLASCHTDFGPRLVADRDGHVCDVLDLSPRTGCCREENRGGKHNCSTCRNDGCCSVYEYCVSCCLAPDHRSLVETALDVAPHKQVHPFPTILLSLL